MLDFSPSRRRKKPKMPCVQPTAAKKNKMTNNTSNTVREGDQPVRQRRSAKITDTTPVNNTATEKNTNTRHARFSCVAGLTTRLEAALVDGRGGFEFVVISDVTPNGQGKSGEKSYPLKVESSRYNNPACLLVAAFNPSFL